ncbi:MAG: hypothetical protein B7Z60_00665 [Ferrovum sp. 37-45-19]|jgi:two-component system OmpR family sensor kinase|nr:MAG: hypothetical protein B7Z60_00665 [Ferrovum sp. 37-45-19]HQT81290.1 ATP-binding protein [Ferrovaceae bacterium]
MKSLQTRLQFGLITLLLTGIFFAAISVYYKTQNELALMQDNALKQIALAFQSTLPWQHGGESVLLKKNQEQEEDNQEDDENLEYIGQIWDEKGSLILSTNNSKHIPLFNVNGYRSITTQQDRLRVFGLNTAHYHIEICQPTEARNIIAISAAKRALMPLLTIVPLLSITVWLLIYFLFKPLKKISAQLQNRDVFTTEPVSSQFVPKELKPLIHSLNSLLERLNNAIQQQQQLIGDAAHTLRTPLTALTLQTDILLRESTSSPQKELIYPLQEGIQRLNHSVDQLLTFAQQDIDKVDTNLELVALKPLIKSIICEFNSQALARSIDLGLTERTKLFVMGNEISLRTMMENLIHNALIYCPPGARVDISLTGENNMAMITVTDTGPGIALVDRERVFDRFYRGPNQNIQGTGLGLAIVKLIVEKHHGEIYLTDNPEGQGLRVVIELPSVKVNKP